MLKILKDKLSASSSDETTPDAQTHASAEINPDEAHAEAARSLVMLSSQPAPAIAQAPSSAASNHNQAPEANAAPAQPTKEHLLNVQAAQVIESLQVELPADLSVLQVYTQRLVQLQQLMRALKQIQAMQRAERAIRPAPLSLTATPNHDIQASSSAASNHNIQAPELNAALPQPTMEQLHAQGAQAIQSLRVELPNLQRSAQITPMHIFALRRAQAIQAEGYAPIAYFFRLKNFLKYIEITGGPGVIRPSSIGKSSPAQEKAYQEVRALFTQLDRSTKAEVIKQIQGQAIQIIEQLQAEATPAIEQLQACVWANVQAVQPDLTRSLAFQSSQPPTAPTPRWTTEQRNAHDQAYSAEAGLRQIQEQFCAEIKAFKAIQPNEQQLLEVLTDVQQRAQRAIESISNLHNQLRSAEHTARNLALAQASVQTQSEKLAQALQAIEQLQEERVASSTQTTDALLLSPVRASSASSAASAYLPSQAVSSNAASGSQPDTRRRAAEETGNTDERPTPSKRQRH